MAGGLCGDQLTPTSSIHIPSNGQRISCKIQLFVFPPAGTDPRRHFSKTVGFTSTTAFSTCSTCVLTFRSSSVANSQRPSQTPRRRSSFLTLGRAVETRLLSISVCATPGTPPSKNDFFPLIAFYLILDVAVGGTNGWFPDGAGNKPWLNGAISGFLLVILDVRDGSSPAIPDAMQLFAQAQDKWSETWPESEDDRAMRMYVFRHFYVCELR
jgi:hypothetical protein